VLGDNVNYDFVIQIKFKNDIDWFSFFVLNEVSGYLAADMLSAVLKLFCFAK